MIVDLAENGGSRIARSSPAARNNFSVAVTRDWDRSDILASSNVVAGVKGTAAHAWPSMRERGRHCRSGGEPSRPRTATRTYEGREHPARGPTRQRQGRRPYYENYRPTSCSRPSMRPSTAFGCGDPGSASQWPTSCAPYRPPPVEASTSEPSSCHREEARHEPYVEVLRQVIKHVVFLQDEHQSSP